jgi:hypothetical protein
MLIVSGVGACCYGRRNIDRLYPFVLIGILGALLLLAGYQVVH